MPYLEQVCSHLAILHEGTITLSDRIQTLFEANKTRIIIRCNQPEKAIELVEQNGLAKLDSAEEFLLQFELLNGNPAAINQLLVNAGIEVSELAQKKESLASLFHQITSVEGGQ